MKKYLSILLFLFTTAILSAQSPRIPVTATCSALQNGNGAGYWQVLLTGFNNAGGVYSASDVQVGDYLYISDGGIPYALEIITVISPSGSSVTVRVDNTGVTGIAGVSTTNSAWVSRGTPHYRYTPWLSNLTQEDNQIHQEANWHRLDSLLYGIDTTGSGGGASPTNLAVSGTSSPLTLTSSTGNDVTVTAGTNVTLSGSSGNITINSTNPGGDLTEIQATSPLSVTSGTGPIPTVALTGIVPVANGGTGSATLNYWDLTTDQVSAGVKRTSGGLLYGSSAPLTGQKFGTTTGGLVGLKGTSSFTSESTWQNFSGLVIESNLSGSLETTRFIATGNDATPNSSAFEWGIRPPGGSRDVGYEMKLTSYSPAPGVNLAQLIIDDASVGSTTPSALTLPYRGVAIASNAGFGESFQILQEGALGLTVRANDAIQAFIESSSGGWAYFSDSTLKHDIVPISLTKDQILGFGAYTFEWNGSDSTDVGIIAQDFQGDPILERVLRGPDSLLGVSPLAMASLALEAASNLQLQLLENKDSLSGEITTDSVTLVKNRINVIDTRGRSVKHTVYPPSSPSPGDWFAVSDSRGTASSKPIYIDFTTAGQKIHSATATITMSTASGYREYRYVNSAVGWIGTY